MSPEDLERVLTGEPLHGLLGEDDKMSRLMVVLVLLCAALLIDLLRVWL